MKKRKIPRVPDDAFGFASVGLAAASGALSMGVFAQYLAAMRPRRRRKSKSSRRGSKR